MADSIEETERKLTMLGGRVRAGWAKTHPAKPEHRDAVRQALLRQWQQKQENANVETQVATEDQKQAKTEIKSVDKCENKKSHGHSH